MTDVFADTFYYLARLSQEDSAHDRAIELSRQFTGRVVTTSWVLTEVADALNAPHQRGTASLLYDTL